MYTKPVQIHGKHSDCADRIKMVKNILLCSHSVSLCINTDSCLIKMAINRQVNLLYKLK